MDAQEAQTITRMAELEQKHAITLVDINEKIRAAAYAKARTVTVIYTGNLVKLKDVQEYAEVLREARNFQVRVDDRGAGEIALTVDW